MAARSSGSATLRCRNSSAASRTTLLRALTACGSSKSGSISVMRMNALPVPSVRTRMKFVWKGRLRSSQLTSSGNGDR